jgi:hypothetical protein
MTRRLASVAALTALVGCATTEYVPQQPRFARVEHEGFRRTVSRCGERYALDESMFSGLDGIFPADTEARGYAQRAQGARQQAFWLSMTSLAMSTAAVILVAVDLQDEPGPLEDEIQGEGIAGLVLAGTSLIPALVSAGATRRSEARLQDALNAYNDSVADRDTGAVCGGTLPGASPKP